MTPAGDDLRLIERPDLEPGDLAELPDGMIDYPRGFLIRCGRAFSEEAFARWPVARLALDEAILVGSSSGSATRASAFSVRLSFAARAVSKAVRKLRSSRVTIARRSSPFTIPGSYSLVPKSSPRRRRSAFRYSSARSSISVMRRYQASPSSFGRLRQIKRTPNCAGAGKRGEGITRRSGRRAAVTRITGDHQTEGPLIHARELEP